MSVVFEDPYYESLDPVSKLVEPLESMAFEAERWINSANKEFVIGDVIADILQSRNISANSMVHGAYKNDCTRAVIRSAWPTLFDDLMTCINGIKAVDAYCAWFGLRVVFPAYQSDRYFWTSSFGSKMRDTARIVCEISSLSEKEIKSMYVDNLVENINAVETKKDRVLTLANTLMINVDEAKPKWKKQNLLTRQIRDLIMTDKWRIRSTTAIANLSDCIKSFLVDGDQDSLARLIEFKYRILQNKSIYTFNKE